MKVLIQDGRSKKYLTAVGGWVNDAREGENFVSHRHAYEVARHTATDEFNIVLYSALGGYAFPVDQGRN